MATYLLITAAVIVLCIAFNRISGKIGMPVILAFILIGMFFGSDGVVKIPFDNYSFANDVCSVALIFIMFYGGFGTKWSIAKPIAAKAITLSSLGTVLTAAILGVFCHFALGITWLESFLIGSVICSTDAASVFSILRSKRLNLKYNTASMLEIESGSNDPFSYMLTAIFISLMRGENVGAWKTVYMVFAQLAYGIILGFIIAFIAVYVLSKVKFAAGFDDIFIIAVAILSYAAPTIIGGNGYLSVYITGIILGNTRIKNKQALVNFFDGATNLMQMLLFFLLGLLAFPTKFGGVALPSLFIALFLTFVARPIAVFAILTPFKSNIRQQLLISFAGMRGAASIVFAIMAITNLQTQNDIFNMVFFIVMFSILFQGSLMPFVSKKLKMTDDESDVMKTFTDYIDEVPVQFIQFTITSAHPWIDTPINQITLPPDSILVLLMRNGRKIVPNGKTVLRENDTLILSGVGAGRIDGVNLYEKEIKDGDEWHDKQLSSIPHSAELIIMVRRDEKVIIPRGSTILRSGDVIVINAPNDCFKIETKKRTG